jgi:nucleolar pre-ribosomal-associated protein 1
LKVFLNDPSTPETDNSARISILKDYLESQKPSNEDDKTAVFLPDIMQAWSFASQSSDDSLLSSVPAVLALLVRTLSNTLELSPYGLKLGRTLLLKRQTELMARGLTATKTKEFVISPVLRLLRELTLFDGGVLAKQIFRARDKVFQGLVRNLGLRHTGDAVEDRKKPSVRTNALRFVLPLIKFLPLDAKQELLSQRDLISALTRDIKDDPPFMVRELLEILKTSVVLDEELPRDVKFAILNATMLGRVYPLYQYDQEDDDLEKGKKPVDELAHEFLLLTCTSPNLGILNRQSGFYPRGVNPDDVYDVDIAESFIDLGLDSIEWMDRFTEKVPVRNTILSDFIQILRPFASIKQSELLQAILKAAPELTADYFFRKKAFSFEPKLTATWMGYSAFVFSTLRLPIPKYFGQRERYARAPPPPAIVLESLLPQPLSQKVLLRCLNHENSLITFFAVRLLCLSFEKLQNTLKMYHEAASTSSSIWQRAADRLIDDFCQRCPPITKVMLAFRRMGNTDLLQREAITKLLVLYYEVVPRIAVDGKFDLSESLAATLKALEEKGMTPQDRSLCAMELENLFRIAHFSPGMRWFNVTHGLVTSPFMSMLKLCSDTPSNASLLKLRPVLASVATENQILQMQTSISALDSLILSLRTLRETSNAPAVYKYLDNCISRCATTPIKYIFALEEVSADVHKTGDEQLPVSLLSLTITEQWAFMIKSVDEAALQEIAQFVARYFAASIKIKEDKKAIKYLVQKIAAETREGSAAQKIIKASRKLVDTVAVPEAQVKPLEAEKQEQSTAPSEGEKAQILAVMLGETTTPADDHKSLVKWTTKEVEEVIEDSYAAALIMLLSSEHLSVRKEAAINISKFAAKLKESDFGEKEQIWLLLSEVVETAKTVVDRGPLPTVISAFASRAIAVLMDPLHCLYPKINKFLSQRPVWELSKIPLMHKILDEGPTHDEAHYAETSWLLTCILVGLRTEADMAMYHKRRVFEKLFSIYNNSYLAGGLRDKILKILFRATKVEGGSTTLITRFSSMTWLQAQVALGGGMPLKVLMETILESCDKNKVGKWSKEAFGTVKADTLKF